MQKLKKGEKKWKKIKRVKNRAYHYRQKRYTSSITSPSKLLIFNYRWQDLAIQVGTCHKPIFSFSSKPHWLVSNLSLLTLACAQLSLGGRTNHFGQPLPEPGGPRRHVCLGTSHQPTMSSADPQSDVRGLRPMAELRSQQFHEEGRRTQSSTEQVRARPL